MANIIMNNKYNVALCSVNSKFIHSSLSVWYLQASIKNSCDLNINSQVLETTINQNQDVIIEKLKVAKPQLVAFSCYIWNILYVEQLLPKVKEILPNCKIVLGGPEVSYHAREYLQKLPLVDYILAGEGELSIVALLNSLQNSVKDKDLTVDGLYTRYNADKNIQPVVLDFQPVSPYTKEYFDALNGRIVYFETSRGCPFSCSFCLSGRCGNVRFFDLEKAFDEILLLANCGTKTIKFVDRTFNCKKERSKKIVKFIIDNYKTKIPDDVCFHFEIAADILDDELIELYQTAPIGLFQLEIGMQSFYKDTLKAVSRKTDTEKLQQNIKKLIKNKNVHIHIDLIAGLQYETLQLFKTSFNIGYRLKPDMLQLGFLKVLYGAPLEIQAENQGLVYTKEPPYQIVENNWLTKQDIEKLHLLEDIFERIYNSGRFTYTLNYLEEIEVINCDNGVVFDDTQNDVHQNTAFEFYYDFSQYCKDMQLKSLDQLTECLFEYLQKLKPVDKVALRDVMALDRLCTNNTGKLPQALKVNDQKLKKAVIALANNPNTKLQKGIKRSVMLGYNQKDTVYFIDYTKENYNKVTRRYKFNQCEFDLIQN